MTVERLRDAAKASPVEYELVCPNGHEVELVGGQLFCVDDSGDTELCGGDENPVAYTIRDLVRSGRTRPRQFTTYPKSEVFR